MRIGSDTSPLDESSSSTGLLQLWDEDHKDVFAHWMGTPCFPAYAFRQFPVDPPKIEGLDIP